MGEILNLEFQSNGRVLANAYYHWSGYTTVAVALAALAVNTWNELKTFLPSKVISVQTIRAVLALCDTGAGMKKDRIAQSLEYMSKKYIDDIKSGDIPLQYPVTESILSVLEKKFIKKFSPMIKKCEGRNEGVVDCLEADMKTTQLAAEETVIIDVASETVDIKRAFNHYNSLEEMACKTDSYYDYKRTDSGFIVDSNGEICTFEELPFDVLVPFKDINEVACYLIEHKEKFLRERENDGSNNGRAEIFTRKDAIYITVI